MAGSISLSLSQQFDEHGKPLSGGLLYTIQAGTTATPQNAFIDYGLTIPHPNPIILDAAGRVPAFYLADGQIKVRLTDKFGVDQIVQDNLLVIGPSDGGGGGGGGGGVDPTTVFQTGDVMWLDVEGQRPGWVRDNGRTLGDASSGATERANQDAQALFIWLYGKYPDSVCPVSGGRTGDALDDWNSHKTIQTPDKRGYIPGGLDGMGAADAGRLASAPVVSGNTTTAGSVVGGATNTLVTANLPPYTPSGSVGINDPGHAHSYQTVGGPGLLAQSNNVGITGATTGTSTTGITASFTGTAQGGTSTPVNNVQKTVLGTFYRKL